MPEYVTKEDFDKFAAEVLHQLRVTNWLLNGRRGAAPPPPMKPITAKEFHDQRRQQREHLRKRRAEKGSA